MIKSSLARSIGAPIIKSSQQALQADGLTPLAVVSETRLLLSRADKHLALDALVVDDLDVDVLAGTPFLIANDISVRPAKCQVRIQDSEVIHYEHRSDPTTASHAVRRAQCYTLRAPSSTTVLWPGDYVELDVPPDLGRRTGTCPSATHRHLSAQIYQNYIHLAGLSSKSWKLSAPKSV